MTLETFVNLSIELTGFSKDTIQPTHDTLRISEEYYKVTIERVDVDTLNQLSQTFISLQGPNGKVDPVQFQKEIIDDPTIGPVAKNILKMWYLAIWYYLPGETAPKNPNGTIPVLLYRTKPTHKDWYGQQCRHTQWDTVKRTLVTGKTLPLHHLLRNRADMVRKAVLILN